MLAQSQIILQLVIMAVFGVICASIASSRGRSTVGWFFVGAFAPCIGLIIILSLSDLKAEEVARERLKRDNRRLRERLRKDRMVADQRHSATEQRLGVHDEALGVDTSRADAKLSGPKPPPADFVDGGARWYYAENDERVGPFSIDRMRELWNEGRIDLDTLVWSKPMPEWSAISAVDQLRSILDA